MKKYKKLCILISIFSIIMSNIIYFNNIKNYVYAENSSEIVMEVNTNRVLYESDAYSKRYMASTTKILTAIVIIENCNINDIVKVTKESVGIEGSSIYLKEGEELTVKDLLYGLMLRSGNDCAETLALYCSGSIENFTILMNETAKKIGAKNSNFINPHGLHDDNHYTTAYDLALISCYAIKNPIFKEIVSTKFVKIHDTVSNSYRYLKNKNKLLDQLEGCTGIKTGYTKKAGRCLVSSCYRNNMEVVCVVLNCGPMFERSKDLIEETFSSYKNYKILSSDNIVDFIETNDKKTKTPVVIKNDVIIPLLKDEIEKVKIEYDIPKYLNLPIEKDKIVGKINIYIENNLIFSQNVYTILDIN